MPTRSEPARESPPVRVLRTAALSAERIPKAYPVVQTAFPGLTLGSWEDFARAMTGGHDDNGILEVENEHGVILGLGAYRLAPDLEHGSILTAEHLIAIDIIDRESVARALIDALEDLATLRRCAVIHATVTDRTARESKSWLVGMLTACSYEVQGLRLGKALKRRTENRLPLFPDPL